MSNTFVCYTISRHDCTLEQFASVFMSLKASHLQSQPEGCNNSNQQQTDVVLETAVLSIISIRLMHTEKKAFSRINLVGQLYLAIISYIFTMPEEFLKP